MPKFSEDEVKYIKDNYDKLKTKQIAERLNRSIGSIRSKHIF